MEKQINTRVMLKHDTEENWLKATGFIPKLSEPIVYDEDAQHPYKRFKIGDGETNVNALPFTAKTIVDVVELPAYSDSNVLYRLTSACFVENQCKKNYWDCIVVNTLADVSNPISVVDNPAAENPKITAYYDLDTEAAYGYYNNNMIPLESIAPAFGLTYDGVKTDITKFAIKDKTIGILLEYHIYTYINGVWNTVIQIGMSGSGDSAEIFNHPANIASGIASHAEGYITKAEGNYSHSEGYKTSAIGRATHTEGLDTEAQGTGTHAEGLNTKTFVEGTHAEGYGTIAGNEYPSTKFDGTIYYEGYYAHAEGQETKALHNNTHSEGYKSVARGIASHAEGVNTTATGSSRAITPEELDDLYKGQQSQFGANHAEGFGSKATEAYAHAEGYKTEANEKAAHAEGWKTIAGHDPSNYAWQDPTSERGQYAHAEGEETKALSYAAHAEGKQTIASGKESHAGGNNSIASGVRSFAHGYHVQATTTDQVVFGKNNAINDNAMFIIGGGNESAYTPADRNKNLFWVTRDGHAFTEWGQLALKDNIAYANNIIPVETLPLEGGINQIYRVDTAKFVSNARTINNWYCNMVDTVPSVGTVFISDITNLAQATITAYYETTTGLAKVYLDATLASMFGRGIGWIELDALRMFLMQNLNIVWGGVVSSTVKVDPKAYYILLEHTLYTYDRDKWKAIIGKTGAGTNAEIFNSGANIASGDCSHAEGYGTKASGMRAHAEGYETTASGRYSHAEGENTTASNDGAHAEGYGTEATGYHAHAEGNLTDATGNYSHAEGAETLAQGHASHSEGANTTALMKGAHAEGIGCHAKSEGAHAEGYGSVADGGVDGLGNSVPAHAEGYYTESTSNSTHTEGYKTKANRTAAHAEGYETLAGYDSTYNYSDNDQYRGQFAHAEGERTRAINYSTHAEGKETLAAGTASHAGGEGSAATGLRSFAHGFYVNAKATDQFVVGSYNADNNKAKFIVGNGSEDNRKNLFEVINNNGVAAIKVGNTTITETQLIYLLALIN